MSFFFIKPKLVHFRLFLLNTCLFQLVFTDLSVAMLSSEKGPAFMRHLESKNIRDGDKLILECEISGEGCFTCMYKR